MSDATFTQEDVDRIVGDRLARDRQTRAAVISEPRTYGLRSPYSWFADHALSSQRDSPEVLEARERLADYAREVAHEIVQGTKEGRYAERVLVEQTRTRNPREHRVAHDKMLTEARALTTGGGTTLTAASSGAAFVTPYFLLSEWALYRGVERTFADQCHCLPIAPYGMQTYVPAFTSATSASQQTEGGAVTESDPSTALQAGAVVTQDGQVTLTQQVVDRAFGGGGMFDAIIMRQLGQQLDASIDAYTISQVITNAQSVAGQASFSVANFYTDIAAGREVLTDTAGVRLRPTCMFTTSDLFSYFSRQVDATTNRPVVTPKWATPTDFPIASGSEDGRNGEYAIPKWARFTGLIMPNGLLWLADDNIPTFGTTSQTQILVSAVDESVVLLESPEPILSTFPQTQAGSLEVILNLRKYVAVVTRHASGTAAITSAAYTTSLK